MAVEIPVYVNIEGAFADASQRVKTAIMPLENTIEKLTGDLGAWREILNESKINDSAFIEAAKNIQAISERLAEADYAMKRYSENAGSIRSMTSTLAELERRWQEMGSAQKYVAEGSTELSANAKDLVRQYKDVTAQIQKEGQSLKDLIAQENKINSLRGRGVKARQTEDRILRNETKTIKVLSEQYRILSQRIQTTPVGTEQFKNLSAQLQQVSKDLKRAQNAASGVAGGLETAAAGSDRARTSINATNQALQRQSTLWMQLRSFAGMYISVFGGLRFLDNIRKTTAELEMQRVALGGIIQDTDRANELFREIKAAALKSPFEIKDLVTYTKQLSAYRIETNKLFDVTMRLADVSAGLGVDMNRLILAYGQVRAASVLRGQELRQFTEAGIPLVELLADKFEKLGREGTTTADVFELISKRAVPFSMIEEIFNDMTNAGGIFYKMQEKQSETLKGQWMKLKDAVTIMYDEIGNTKGVHAAMENLIQDVLKLTRSWRDVARFVAAGTASLVTYTTVSKAAAISSATLTKAEAMRLAVTRKQIVSTPALIAAIIGETNAKELSRKASHRLMAAQVKLSTANNILTKSFQALRVAILKNPYAAAAAAAVALVGTIIAIRKRNEEAAVSVESLNSSIAKLKDASDSVAEAKRLVDIYEELSAKADKTAEEQEKLSRVTRELAKSFPGAVVGLDAEANALDINIGKVKELAAAEAALTEMRLRKQAEGARENIKNLEAEARRLSDNILQVQQHGGLYMGQSVWTGESIFKKVSEKTLEKWGERLREITKLIYEYQTALEQVDEMDFIGPMPLEEGGAQNQLKTWKKTVAEIQKAKVAAGATQLFTDDDITKFESVLKFSKELKKKQDELTQSLKSNRELLKSATDDTKEALNAEIEADEKTLELVNALKAALGIIFKSTGGRDTRLSQLRSEISELTNAYKKFKELQKYKSKDEALIDINTLFPQLKGAVPNLDYVVQELEKKLAKVKADLKKSPNSKTLLDMQRALETEISNLKFDDLKNEIELKLKRLSEEIKRSETARNFYNDIFDLTGDQDLATSITVSVYGGIGSEFKDRLQQQLNKIFETMDVDADMQRAIDVQDFDYIFAHLPEGMEEYRDKLVELRDAQQKFSAEQAKTWLNDLKKAKTYAEERVKLATTTQQRISAINALSLTPEQKQKLIGQYTRHEAEETAKLQYEAFKNSPMYVELFANLDTASASMLKNMRSNLEGLKEQWKNLSPKELKEMQSRLNELDKQLANRNPFKALEESIVRYQNLTSKKSRKDAELEAVEANDNLRAQQEILEERIKQYNIAVELFGIDSKDAEIAREQVKQQEEVVNLAEEHAHAAQNVADSYRDASQQISASADAVGNFLNQIAPAIDGVKQIVDTFGSRETIDTFNTIADGAVKTISGAAKLAGGVAKAIGNPADITAYVDIVAGLGDVIAGTFGMHNQLLIDEANRKIAEQDKLIEKLNRSYDKLGREMERVFGNEYIYSYQTAMDTLLAQQQAYIKQAEAQAYIVTHASKAADREVAATEEERLRALAAGVDDALMDLREKTQDFLVGSGLTSAAEEFANSWYDAYREFGSTTDAIQEKMEDMIKNLIVKTTMADAAKHILQPFFDKVEELSAENGLSPTDIEELSTMLRGKVGELDTSLTSWMQVFQSMGMNLRSQTGNFSGIARNIATASEESILGLAAGINTQNYYMSYVPTISADLQQILALMGGAPMSAAPTVATTSAEEGPIMPSVQEMVYDHLPNIDRNISEMLRLMNNVIKPNGTSAPYYVATKM